MKKTITLLLITLLTGFSLKAQWAEVGGPYGFSAGQAWWLSMDFDGTTPYAAYRDCANGCSPTVMQYNGTAWQNVGTAGITGSGSDYVSLAVANSIPYIAFSDAANGSKLCVMKYVSSSWSYIGTALSSGVITGASITFDPTNNLLYAASLASGTGALTISKYNLTTQVWSSVSMTGFPTGHSTNYAGLSVYNGHLFVSYSDWNTDQVTVVKRDATTGTWSTIGSTATGVAPSRVCFDNSGTPHLAYVVYTPGPVAKGAVVKFNGTAWTSVGSSLSLTSDTIYESSNGLALAMDGNTPYVAYGNANNYGKMSVSKFNGSIWTLVGAPYFSMGGSPYNYHNLKIVNGTPYVAYMAQSPMISNLRAFMHKYDVTTGINAIDINSGISIYPNPATDVLNIEINSISAKATVEILDLTGKVVISQPLSNKHTIDMSHLSAGIYLVKIVCDENISVKRIVKQ